MMADVSARLISPTMFRNLEHKDRGFEVEGAVFDGRGGGARSDRDSEHSVIEIDSFVPRQQIDQRYFDTPYYVAPNEPVALLYASFILTLPPLLPFPPFLNQWGAHFADAIND
jgi:hypothetical protein